MHIYNICVQFLRGTSHLVEKEKTSHYDWGGHTDYCWKRRITRERGAGAYCRSETGVSMVQIDLQGKHLLNILHFIVYNVFIVAVFIEVLKWSLITKPPRSNRMYKAVFYSLFLKPIVGSSSLTVKGLKDALDQVFLTPFSLSTSRSTISKNSCNTEEVHRCIVSETQNNLTD